MLRVSLFLYIGGETLACLCASVLLHFPLLAGVLCIFFLFSLLTFLLHYLEIAEKYIFSEGAALNDCCC
jgi:hypothetical protein